MAHSLLNEYAKKSHSHCFKYLQTSKTHWFLFFPLIILKNTSLSAYFWRGVWRGARGWRSKKAKKCVLTKSMPLYWRKANCRFAAFACRPCLSSLESIFNNTIMRHRLLEIWYHCKISVVKWIFFLHVSTQCSWMRVKLKKGIWRKQGYRHGTHVFVNWLKLDPLIMIFGRFCNNKKK